MMVTDKKSININGSISGVVNLGDNSININTIEKNKISQFDNTCVEKLEIRSNSNNFTEPKKHKFYSKIVKIIVDVIIGILVSVVAGAILYKLNIN